MSALFRLSSKSGGLIYHVRALRNQNQLWLPFKLSIKKELNRWLQQIPTEEALILIGGSGGYTLDAEFISRFKHVVLVDLDPLAGFFFRRNFPNTPLTFISKDIFSDQMIKTLLKDYPNSPWLWSNLLGQLGLTHTEQQVKGLLYKVNEAMSEKNWFSYHDVYSYKLNFKQDLELADHLTQQQLQISNKEIHFWELLPNQIHLIESGFSISKTFSS